MRTAAAIALLLAACKGIEVELPPPPSDRTHSVVALSIAVDDPVGHRADLRPWNVYFVRFEGDRDPTKQPKPLKSQLRYGNTHYLLDAKPGKYAAVACFEENHGKKVYTYFAADLIRETVQDVGEGEIVYLGRANIASQMMSKSADKAQSWYLSLIDPELYHADALGQVFRRSRADVSRRWSLNRSEKALASFRKYTDNALAGTAWSGKVKHAN